MPSAPQKLLHLGVIAQETHIERIRTVQKYEAQSQVAPALEQMAAELANAHTAMNMRPAKSFAQIA